MDMVFALRFLLSYIFLTYWQISLIGISPLLLHFGPETAYVRGDFAGLLFGVGRHPLAFTFLFHAFFFHIMEIISPGPIEPATVKFMLPTDCLVAQLSAGQTTFIYSSPT